MSEDSRLTDQLVSPWFTVEAASAYLSVSHNTVRKMIHCGEIRASRIGAGFRIERI